MCIYITLAIPAQADLRAATAILRAHGMTFREFTAESAAAVVRTGDHYGATYSQECDCDTVVGMRGRPDTAHEESEKALQREAERLKRKRWSQTRIETRLNQLRTVQERAEVHRDLEARDWVAALSELVTQANADGVRLFLHFYRGMLEHERVQPNGIQVARVRSLTPDVVMEFKMDVIYEFRAR